MAASAFQLPFLIIYVYHLYIFFNFKIASTTLLWISLYRLIFYLFFQKEGNLVLPIFIEWSSDSPARIWRKIIQHHIWRQDEKERKLEEIKTSWWFIFHSFSPRWHFNSVIYLSHFSCYRPHLAWLELRLYSK
jgi:hypothetical protein